jgi:serine/threonine protein kinase
MKPTANVATPPLEALIGQIADEFTQRLNAGERPDAEEYAARYPEHAAVVREVLAALQLIRDTSAPGPVDDSSHLETAREPSGELGDFRILREIGRGGMGVVYEAEQISLGRRVALKVLPYAAVLDSRQLQRFKNEARAAATLHHPNIVPVHAVGCERGVHYYAMQYIEGQTLAGVIGDLRRTEGLDATAVPVGHVFNVPSPVGQVANLPSSPRSNPVETTPYEPGQVSNLPHETPREPKALLSTERSTKSRAYFRNIALLGIQAAEALDHAHQQGIVHRDIKPSNLILDLQGKLWVTDFGLAHVESGVELTMTGDLIGTLRYMSPEQALAKRVVIDHRTDIYSLGATLYELLALQPAFSGTDRQELLRQIAFEEPRAPRRVNRGVPAEMETIILKAIAKNPSERYTTAQELADDLRQYLDDKPIRARPPTFAQRTAKWSRRHRALVWSAVNILILATAGSIISTALIWQAKNLAVFNETQANQERIRANEERQIAVAVLDFLRKKLLLQADVTRQADHLMLAGGTSSHAKWNVTVRELLDRAADELKPDKIQDQFPNQPVVQAFVLQSIGNAYRGIGEYEQAIEHLARAQTLLDETRGANDPVTLETMADLASAYAYAGNGSKAIPLLEYVRDQQIEKLGADHPDALQTLAKLAFVYFNDGELSEAIRLLEQIRDGRIERLGAEHGDTLETLANLAHAYRREGKLPEAIRLLEHVRLKAIRRLGADHPETLLKLNLLALAYKEAGRYSEAIHLFEQVRDKQIEKIGCDHPNTLMTLCHLGSACGAAGKLSDAIRLLEQGTDQIIEKLGTNHPVTLATLDDLAMAYVNAGKLYEAIRLLKHVRNTQVEQIGGDHPHTLSTVNHLGLAYQGAGKLPEAIRLFEQVRDKHTEIRGAEHRDTLNTLRMLASAYCDAGKLPDAFHILELVRAKQTERFGADHPDTTLTLGILGLAYFAAGKLSEAIRLFEQLRDKLTQRHGVDHRDVQATLNNLAVAYCRSRKFAEAIPLFERVRDKLNETLGASHSETLKTVHNLAAAYKETGKVAEAIALLGQVIDAQIKTLGADHL